MTGFFETSILFVRRGRAHRPVPRTNIRMGQKIRHDEALTGGIGGLTRLFFANNQDEVGPRLDRKFDAAQE